MVQYKVYGLFSPCHITMASRDLSYSSDTMLLQTFQPIAVPLSLILHCYCKLHHNWLIGLEAASMDTTMSLWAALSLGKRFATASYHFSKTSLRRRSSATLTYFVLAFVHPTLVVKWKTMQCISHSLWHHYWILWNRYQSDTKCVKGAT